MISKLNETCVNCAYAVYIDIPATPRGLASPPPPIGMCANHLARMEQTPIQHRLVGCRALMHPFKGLIYHHAFQTLHITNKKIVVLEIVFPLVYVLLSKMAQVEWTNY